MDVNLQIVNELIFCLETGKWFGLEEIVQKCAYQESKLDLILNFLKQNELLQMDDKNQVFRLNPKMTGLINRLEEIQSQEKSREIQKKNGKDSLVIRDSLSEAQVSHAIVNFTAISLIIIIGFYLVACTLAPLVNLNNQTFRLIFTLAGGIPSILFYSKIQTNNK